MFLSISESGRHEFYPHGLTFVNPSLCGWVSPTPAASPTLGSFGPSFHRCCNSRMLLRGPSSAQGVSGTPHREVCNNVFLNAYNELSYLSCHHERFQECKQRKYISIFFIKTCNFHLTQALSTHSSTRLDLARMPSQGGGFSLRSLFLCF